MTVSDTAGPVSLWLHQLVLPVAPEVLVQPCCNRDIRVCGGMPKLGGPSVHLQVQPVDSADRCLLVCTHITAKWRRLVKSW